MVSVGKNHRFKEWLLKEMGQRGWSQSDLARSADLNRAVINKLLNGQSTPSPTTLESIARAFKIPIESVYRFAGLLPSIPESDSFIEEATHLIGRSKTQNAGQQHCYLSKPWSLKKNRKAIEDKSSFA